MIYMWFIYGLSFFILGLGILIYPKKDSTFTLARYIWLIAAFGVFHGINEWLDMFLAVDGPFPQEILKRIRLFALVTSFFFLVLFGVKIISIRKKQYRLLWVFPIGLLLAWAGIVFFSNNRFLIGDIMARYLICVPGTFLTAFALFLQIKELRKTRL